MSDSKILLPESEIPRSWYNVLADTPTGPQPVLHPGTGQPWGPTIWRRCSRWTDPAGGLDRSRDRRCPTRSSMCCGCGGPTPLHRAHRLEQRLGTGSRIYYKNESVSPAGSHKPNTAVPRRTTTPRPGAPASPPRPEPASGAARWRSPRQLFGLECKVYMVRVCYDQKPYRRMMMEAWGAERRSQPVARHQRRAPDARGKSRLSRQPRDRHLRGGRGCRHPRGHELLTRLRLEPRPAAPDGDRPGGSQAARAGRRERCRRGRRLRRRRLELRRPGAAVHRRQDRRGRDRGDRVRAIGMSHADPGAVQLRLRRHRPADSAGGDAYARSRLRSAGDPCRRPALPRGGADRVPADARWTVAGRGLRPAGRVRGGPHVRPLGGDHPGARVARMRSRGRSTPPDAPTRPDWSR